MNPPESHEPGQHVGWVVASLTGMFSVLRALVSKRKEPDKDEILESVLTKGGRRASLIAQLDEAETRLERLETGRLRNEAGIERNQAGIDRIARLLEEMRTDFLGELDRQVRRLREEIDDRCSGSKGHNKPQ